MSWSTFDDFDNHEDVFTYRDEASGLHAVIALHSTTLGPAAGGCRRWRYDSEVEAVRDALRLSRGMSFKNAMAGLPFGGGKAVILASDQRPPTAREMREFGAFVDSLDGRYITAEDVGVSTEDMRVVAERTRYVSGLPQQGDSAGGDPSPWTALGVYLSLNEAAQRELGVETLKGVSVAVQGVGHVGYHLCKLLHRVGAKLVVADINRRSTDRVRSEFNAVVVAPDEILRADVDVVAPCALGGVLNRASIATLRAKVVAGAANNQLATREDAVRLHEAGVLFLPDYVINAGGIIAVAREYAGGFTTHDVAEEVAQIPRRLGDVLSRASQRDRSPVLVADEMARDLISGRSDDPTRRAA